MSKQIWLPPRVTHELREGTRRHAADIDKVTYADATCVRWTRELRRLDPLLRMVRANDRPVLGLQLVPGCYHIIRDNPSAPMTVTPICNNEGGYMEPPGSLLDRIKATDLQNKQVERMREKVILAEKAAAEKEKDEDYERICDTALEHWKAGSQVRISMSDHVPWSQNVAGRRGARR